jgi:hypothetical protein
MLVGLLIYLNPLTRLATPRRPKPLRPSKLWTVLALGRRALATLSPQGGRGLFLLVVFIAFPISPISSACSLGARAIVLGLFTPRLTLVRT